jgi:cell division protein FtsZ
VLRSSNAAHKIQVGANITRGLGAGADPNVGKKAIEEDRDKLAEVLAGSDMVFVTAGMGGGTGTGGAPIVASIAKSIGSLVVGIVTKPFKWEGKKRMLNAEQGIQELKQYVDSLIIIPNERLLSILDKSTNAFAAFDKPNEVLYEATRGIADIITVEGLINVDFADVRAVMNQSGEALMGCGISSGENRAIEAAQKAISSPLLEGVNIKGAKSVLLNVTGSSNLTIQEVNEGNNVIFEAAGEEANVIFGCVQKEEMNDYVSYTVIATGFDGSTRSFSSKTVKTVKPKQKEPDVFAGKFNFTNEATEIDSNDLDVPTIYRVKRPLSQLDVDKEDDNVDGGYIFNSSKLNWSKDKPQKQVEQSKVNDDEDSSSFLRMIMD